MGTIDDPRLRMEHHINELKERIDVAISDMPHEINDGDEAEIWEAFEALETILHDTNELAISDAAQRKRRCNNILLGLDVPRRNIHRGPHLMEDYEG